MGPIITQQAWLQRGLSSLHTAANQLHRLGAMVRVALRHVGVDQTPEPAHVLSHGVRLAVNGTRCHHWLQHLRLAARRITLYCALTVKV
jgi:hypothetical protein